LSPSAVLNVRVLAGAAVAIATGIVFAVAASAQPPEQGHPGESAYRAWCAYCHEDPDSDAPTTESLRQLSRANIRYSLEYGYMREYARPVPADQLQAMIDWLPIEPVNAGGWVEAASCPADRKAVQLDGVARIATSFGLDFGNNRAMTAEQAGLSARDLANLELDWVVAFPQTATMRSQPLVIGKTIFIAATDSGHLYALDTETGCVKWSYASDMTLRSSLAFGEATAASPATIVMGDAAGRIHGVDAQTGEERWVTDIRLTDLNRITGAPVVYGNRVFAPMSTIEVNYSANPDYECCTGQGAVVALDIATGERIWVGRTMEDAQKTMVSRAGTQQWGPSGAIIWSTPIIDPARNSIYVGTGENLSWPSTDTSDAIIAYDMDTGARKWVFQATKADIWNYACGRRGPNCDWPGEYQSPDHDFGATAMLVTLEDGTDLIMAGQKSGVLWALDPDTGELVWSNKIGGGSASGGMRWGLAFDGERVFAPLNDPARARDQNPNWGPGLHAIDATSGEIQWTYQPNARDCGQDLPVADAGPPPGPRMLHIDAPVLPPARNTAPEAQSGAPARAETSEPQGEDESAAPRPAARCRVGLSAAPMLIDGAVVTGSNGGMLRIFDGPTGQVLFEYQTNQPYPETVNGLEGQGGSLDSAPYVAGDGALFVQSGYARFGQPPGNVLMAFRPKE
jgi:polyvinyl alcohol dehydrogenase (cytochrome)